MSDRNQHIDQETFRKYLNGELNSQQQYEVERALQQSVFEQEAMEGLESVSTQDWEADLDTLNQKLAGYRVENKRFNWYSAAAIIALLIVSTWAIWFITGEPGENLAMQEQPSEEVQTNPQTTPNDSVQPTNNIELQSDKPAEVAAEDITKNSSQTGSGKDQNVIADNQSTTEEIEINTESSKVIEEVNINEEVEQIALADEDLSGQEMEEEILDGFTSDDQTVLDEVAISQTEPIAASPQPTFSKSESEAIATNRSKKKSANQKALGRSENNLEVANNNDGAGFAGTLSNVTRGADDSPQKSVSEEEYAQYVSENLRYPEAAISANVEGSVKVIFTVNADSTVSDFIVLQGIGHGCDEEAIRLIKEGPKWIPKMIGDKPIVSDGFQEIVFSLEKK